MKIDSITINNPPRDNAWQDFIKRKDVKEFFSKGDEFKFPLERGWYEVWCQAWDKAWWTGWNAKKWVGLTDDEAKRLWSENTGYQDPTDEELEIVRNVEAYLKEKNL